MRLLRTVCVFGIALCLATSVYAGTQSVKISGDLTLRALARQDYDLNRHHEEPDPQTSTASGAGTSGGNPQTGTNDWQTWAMSTAEVEIDADLTDNVSAVVRLYNQRDWNVSTKLVSNTDVILGRDEGSVYTRDGDEFDIGVDLAYIELKEFLYSPLTLKVGRQDLWFGKGFIVGANLADYNANISAPEYTAVSAFDAIRGTLDYDPWTIDLVAAKIWENEIGSEDDEDLYGLNVGYLFDVYNGEAEAYWFIKDDRQIAPSMRKERNTVHTLGLRGSFDPIEDWTVAGEAAYQGGHFVGFRNQIEKRNRSAWALDVSAECRYFKETFMWKPVFGTEYILYSGDDDGYPTASSEGSWNGWDPMYRGKFDSAYREFVGKYNITHQGWVARRADFVNSYPDASYTNQHQVLLFGSVEPADSITVDGRVGFFWQQHHTEIPRQLLQPERSAATNTRLQRKLFLGTELDVGLTWDYTEDVSFGVLAAWFFPGGFYYDQSDDPATDLVGTMKLSF